MSAKTTVGTIQSIRSKLITEAINNITIHPSLQHDITVWTGPQLLIPARQQQDRQRWRNTGNEHSHRCQGVMQDHTRPQDSREISSVNTDGEHLNRLLECSWPSIRAEIQKDLQWFWSFRDQTVLINGVTMKGENNNTNITPWKHAEQATHKITWGVEQTLLLACESI